MSRAEPLFYFWQRKSLLNLCGVMRADAGLNPYRHIPDGENIEAEAIPTYSKTPRLDPLLDYGARETFAAHVGHRFRGRAESRLSHAPSGERKEPPQSPGPRALRK